MDEKKEKVIEYLKSFILPGWTFVRVEHKTLEKVKPWEPREIITIVAMSPQKKEYSFDYNYKKLLRLFK